MLIYFSFHTHVWSTSRVAALCWGHSRDLALSPLSPPWLVRGVYLQISRELITTQSCQRDDRKTQWKPRGFLGEGTALSSVHLLQISNNPLGFSPRRKYGKNVKFWSLDTSPLKFTVSENA